MIRFVFLSLLLFSPALYPWGIRGHRIIARIAENHLTDNARKQVADLLKDDTLTKVANEPDTYRSNSKWKCASPFHYASVDDKETYLASEKHEKGDIVMALLYFEDMLRNHKLSAAKRASALKWLVHLVGDIHQPLHVGRACDRGGNSTEVRWFGEKSNLHKVWDAELINHQELSFSEYASEIDTVDAKTQSLWLDSSYLDWAGESQAVRTQIYTCLGKDNCCADPKAKGGCKVAETTFNSCTDQSPTGRPNLEYAYIEKNRDLLNRQLLKGGIRLASLLNAIFADSPFNAKQMKTREAIKTNPIEACVMKALE